MSNKDILIIAITEWLCNIASSVLPQVQVPQHSNIGRMMSGFLGINPTTYNIWNELGFLLAPTIKTFIEPQLRKYIDAIPEENIKDMAMSYADVLYKQAQEKGAVNMFGVELGPVTFEGLKNILQDKFNANINTISL